jgi:DNA-binding protein HU-beta
MTKAELIENVSNETGLSKRQTGDIVGAIFNSVGNAISNEGRFSYPGFGTFTVRERAARTGRNPRTGATIQINASKTVKFKAAPNLKGDL